MPQFPGSWSPDGKTLAFSNLTGGTASWDVMTVSMAGSESAGWKPAEPKPFVNQNFVEFLPAFSPDGHWIAFASNESGRFEVYVRPFPGPGGVWQVSAGGGAYPRFAPHGKQLFYLNSGKLMVADYSASADSFRAEKPREGSTGTTRSRGLLAYPYDVHPDGKRVAMLAAHDEPQQQPAAATKINFVFNFFEELRRKLPKS